MFLHGAEPKLFRFMDRVGNDTPNYRIHVAHMSVVPNSFVYSVTVSPVDTDRVLEAAFVEAKRMAVADTAAGYELMLQPNAGRGAPYHPARAATRP